MIGSSKSAAAFCPLPFSIIMIQTLISLKSKLIFVKMQEFLLTIVRKMIEITTEIGTE
jgi:hypothetical protein